MKSKKFSWQYGLSSQINEEIKRSLFSSHERNQDRIYRCTDCGNRLTNHLCMIHNHFIYCEKCGLNKH
ncbi:hypothetical protein [Cytobacillus purgationiresistens]|uniref:DNA-directed RNA polymerase subunit RPC12/RpoP n=1 Tax=Cytobacillus purgationiresistens TaxID=863449 RepID=A0ABU0ADR8_9BACI|nr:hypothetical protein [Cytobacillus purgationiresistens]MDQ0269382.1 DNA-directed RNA polymerase subunit RPC12/RpoP [Cytobacillus purgationiresistens]